MFSLSKESRSHEARENFVKTRISLQTAQEQGEVSQNSWPILSSHGMKITVLRICILLVLTLAEFSFLGILFPLVSVPVLPLLAVVAWALVLGFPKNLWMTMSATLLFDGLSTGALTVLTPYGVLLAYATSFLSRRLLVEHRGSGLLLYSFLAALAISFYQFLGHVRALLPDGARWLSLLPEEPAAWTQTLLTFLLCFILFLPVYFFAKRFEEHVQSLRQKQYVSTR